MTSLFCSIIDITLTSHSRCYKSTSRALDWYKMSAFSDNHLADTDKN